MVRKLPASRAAGALVVVLLSACSRAPDVAAPPAKGSGALARHVDPRCSSIAAPPTGEPVLLEGEEPSYPLQALAAGAEGRVSAGCTITDEGRVVDCAVLNSDVPALDAAVIEALQRRIYCPATKDAAPVAVRKTFSFRFQLAEDAPRRASRARR